MPSGTSLFITVIFFFKHFDCDLSSSARDRTCTPCVGRRVLTTRLMKVPAVIHFDGFKPCLEKKKKPCLDSFLVYQIRTFARVFLMYFSVLKLKF